MGREWDEWARQGEHSNTGEWGCVHRIKPIRCLFSVLKCVSCVVWRCCDAPLQRNDWPWCAGTWGGSGMSRQDRESTQTEESGGVSTKIRPFNAKYSRNSNCVSRAVRRCGGARLLRNECPWSACTWGGSRMSGKDRESTQVEESKDYVSTKIHPFGADSAV